MILGMMFLFVIGVQHGSYKANKKYDNLLKQSNAQFETIENQKNKVLSYEKAVTHLSVERDSLKEVVADLKSRDPEVKYIVSTETVMVPSEPILVTPDLPSEYLFTLEDKLPVARFAVENEDYVFETYDLSYRSSIAIGKKSTSSVTEVMSSATPGTWIEIASATETHEIKEKTAFKPQVALGLTTGLPRAAPGASLIFSWWHPGKNVDLLNLRTTVTQNSGTRLGLDLVSYNVGSALPLLSDTWTSVGTSNNVSLDAVTFVPNLDFTVSTKF